MQMSYFDVLAPSIAKKRNLERISIRRERSQTKMYSWQMYYEAKFLS